MFSKQYLQLVKDKNIRNLTNSQHRFVEFLLKNHKIIGQIGSYQKLFKDTQEWIKNNHNKL